MGKLEKVYHQTVKKVTEDYEGIRFNTAISQMMVFINEAYKAPQIPVDYVKGFVQLLAPLVPHVAEELWEKLGSNESISYVAWPTFDESKLVENEIEMAIQFNGKVRTKIVVNKDFSKDELEKAVLADAKVIEILDGKEIKKLIAIPGKLVNIVVG